MGAETFIDTIEAKGRTAAECFAALQEQARYSHGNDGYTGSIAEKTSFITITNKHELSGISAWAYANLLLDSDDPRISDKWGPAGCIKEGDSFVFFGWASS